MLLNVAGAYRGQMTTSGVGVTQNGFPQFVVGLQAVEFYDEVAQEWVAVDPAGPTEAMGYLVLFGKNDKETQNSKQVKLVTGWDGMSFESLNDMDCNGVPVLFRMKEHEYEDNTTLQVDWIDEYDASPTRSVKKLDANAAKELTAKYAAVLNVTKAPVKAASAKPAAAAPAAPAKPAPAPTPAPAARPKAPSPKAPKPPKATAPTGGCTQTEAWDAVCALRSDKVTTDAVTEVWLKTVEEVCPGNSDAEKITPAQWASIRDKVVAKVSAL
jgi:hypothetical protein